MDNKIPEIKRSRGYFLYDTKGKRYLDFYQDSGRAILGHRMDGITRVIKSTVARGLTSSYPSVYTNRLQKELNRLFPFVTKFMVYRNMERALISLSSLEGRDISISSFVDFPSEVSRFGIWRPFIDSSLKWDGFDFFIPLLPFSGNFGPVVVAVNKIDKFPGISDDLSPMICDMLIKSISSLIRYRKDYNCMDRSLFMSPLWDRIGPYLRFKLKGEDYFAFYRKALETSVLLPPESDIPGIIPCSYENGQIKDFMNMTKQFKIK